MVFDESRLLPDWKQAEVHGRASKVGTYDEGSGDVCHCCQEKVHKEEIPLCENTKTLEFLGFGFPLFYMFIRNCIILLLLLIISNNLISIFISVTDGQKYCAHHHTGKHVAAHTPELSTSAAGAHHLLLAKYSHLGQGKQAEGKEHAEDPNLYLSRKCESLFIMIARTEKDSKDYEVVLRIGSFIIHVLTLLYIKDKIIKTWAYYDEMESDMSDYAVVVKNIPEGMRGINNKLATFLTKDIRAEDGKPFEIFEIILVPDSEKVHHLSHEEEEEHEKYLLAKSNNDQHAVGEHLKELAKLHHEKIEIVEGVIGAINHDTIPASDAIIIFQTEPQKQYFLEKIDEYQENGIVDKYFGKQQERVVFEEAPEPREIIYENLAQSRHRAKNVAIGWGLSLLFLLAVTGIFYLLQLAKTNFLVSAIDEEEENPSSSTAKTHKTIATIIAWATLLGIVFFNKFVMGNVLHIFTHMQKHDNKAHEDFSFAFKYALGMFFTTALMTIMVEALKFHNYYKHDFGVIEQETIMFILCAFLVPTIWAIHPLQQCHARERHHHFGKSDVTQHEANHLMADYHYDMGKRYAELIEMMWFTFLYADLIPIGAFLILVGFGIYYWIDKYNLLRRSSLEGNISGDLAMKCLFLLDLTLFWRFLGELIFDVQIREGAETLTLIFLGLSIVYLLVPWDQFLELVNKEEFKLNDKRFEDEMHRFGGDNYKLYHPIYKEISKKGGQQSGQAYLTANELLLFATGLIKKENAAATAPASGYAPGSLRESAQPNLLQGFLPPPGKPNINFNYK